MSIGVFEFTFITMFLLTLCSFYSTIKFLMQILFIVDFSDFLVHILKILIGKVESSI